MKIMAFVGSPRKNSNVDLLMDKVIEGAKSRSEVTLEKIYLYDANIKYCTGCMVCTPLKGSKDCPIKDDMAGICQRMQETDAFIFGSPNHGHTLSAAMTNFLSRMQALLKMHVERNDAGGIVKAVSQPLIGGKKAVVVVSQGDPTPSTAGLLLRVFDSNMKEFHLKKTGEVFRAGNLPKTRVKEKDYDLQQAFEAGVRLAEV